MFIPKLYQGWPVDMAVGVIAVHVASLLALEPGTLLRRLELIQTLHVIEGHHLVLQATGESQSLHVVLLIAQA
jgi:hypothetical protein